ncbi:class I SAM-dependent methyltransferase [Acinetobacter variabilis]|uniref:class I SAM-dependent methyltransferase n=1 Tax=Acinetobacter variabilis TaxID=70346 RepID=UPI0030FB5B40
MGNVDYYNQNSEQFFQTTLNVNMESLYQAFLVHLPNRGYILDLGCGSGRDTLAFKNKGYQVEALDYSKALVEKATALTGIPIRYQSFYDLNDQGIYDGIWACASLLHCKRDRLADVMQSILNALKVNGILYMSFKYGDKDREKDGRKFTDLNEEQAEELLNQFYQIELIKHWITIDQRPDREEKWLNILVKKNA